MPFTLKLRKNDPIIVMDKGDDPAVKLAALLLDFKNLPKSVSKTDPPPDHDGGFSGLKSNIIVAINANKDDADLISLVRDCWNLICAAYTPQKGKKPTLQGTDYELPAPAPPRANRNTAVAIPAIPNPTSQAYQTWKLMNSAQILWFRKFENSLTHEPDDQKTPLSNQEWDDVIDSVWILGEYYPTFHGFFALIHGVYLEFQSHPNIAIDLTRIRVRALLRKLVTNPQKGRKPASVENYKGACNEILDVVQTLRFRNNGLTRIAIPKANKTFDTDDVDASLQSDSLREQDIDRTEVYFGDVKLYIEVKSDVHTAVDKHDGVSDQLQRIKAVVVNRQKNDALNPNPRYQTRSPAVSIVNEDGWLELFTTRTARNYYKLGFYLILSGKLVTPEQIKALDTLVWSDASHGQPYPASLQAQHLKLLKTFFDTNKSTYGAFSAKLANV